MSTGSTILEQAKRRVQYVDFDPTNKQHIEAYAQMRSGVLPATIRFNLEHPFLTVPDMINSKIVDKFISDALA